MNAGRTDRLIRVALGIVILFFVPSTSWAWIGLLPLLTGLTGWCPLYALLGWSTVRKVSRT